MASFYAELEVAGHTYPVRVCQFSFTQATDERGRVRGKVRHGLVHLALDTPQDDFLLNWGTTVNKPLAGHVTFFETNQRTARETMSFAAGECVGYHETFDAGDGGAGAYVSHLTIAASKLVLSAGGPLRPYVSAKARGYAGPIAAKTTVQSVALKVIKLAGGAKKGWNKELNKELAPNTIYEVDGITYTTDEQARVISTTAKNLKLQPRDRNSYQQGKSVDIKEGKDSDQGGHLIAARLGGPGEQINYQPMDAKLNQGSWKAMENEWADALKEGKTVEVEIESVFEGDSKRPVAFLVNFNIISINGVKQDSRTFLN